MTTRRKFTDEEKLVILDQAEKVGISATLRHYNLSYSVFAKWKQKFMTQNSNSQSDTFKTRTRLKQLHNENLRLKKIIADQALELERKEEELKKITKK